MIINGSEGHAGHIHIHIRKVVAVLVCTPSTRANQWTEHGRSVGDRWVGNMEAYAHVYIAELGHKVPPPRDTAWIMTGSLRC